MNESIYYDREMNKYLYVTSMGNGFSIYDGFTRDWIRDTHTDPKEMYQYIDPESFNYCRYLQAQIDYLHLFIIERLK